MTPLPMPTSDPTCPVKAFNRIWSHVAQREFLVPRNHATIGGMWAEDRYQRGEVVARLCADGAMRVLVAPGLFVWEEYLGDLCFRTGDEQALLALALGLEVREGENGDA